MRKVTFIHSGCLDGDFFHRREMLDYLKHNEDEFPKGFPGTIVKWIILFLEQIDEIEADSFCPAMLEIGGSDDEIAAVFVPEMGTFFRLEDFKRYLRNHCERAFANTLKDFKLKDDKRESLRKDFYHAIDGHCELLDDMCEKAKRYGINRN